MNANPGWKILGEELLHRSQVRKSPEFKHCEILLKGAEVELPDGGFLMDKERTARTKMRLRWWLPARGRTYHDLCMPAPNQSDRIPREVVADSVEALCPGYPQGATPLFFGHYWLPFEGYVELIAPNVACLDYSVAKQGALVAYRWDGEQTLAPEKLVVAVVQP